MNDAYNGLWVERFRPQVFEDIVLTKEDRSFFKSLKDKGEIPHLLFAGNPGVGKTTTSKVIINDLLGSPDYLYLNASDSNSIDDIRHKVINFAKTKSFDGKIKIVLLDEADSVSFEGMKALRNVLEEFSLTCRFIMTCNYLHKIIPAIQSRCVIINLVPPIEGILQRVKFILQSESIIIPEDQKPLLLKHIKENLPDLRRIINDIQKYSVSGTLNVRSNTCSEFASNIVKKVLGKQDLMVIRKQVIENEKAFSNDYRHLMKLVFEEIFNSELNYDQKSSLLLIAADSMADDAVVIDKEINFFAALLKMSRSIV